MNNDIDNALKVFNTSCEKCIFAKYEDNVQVDCKAKVFEKFKTNKKIKINEDKTFFTLDNFVCRYIRPSFWGKDLTDDQRIEKIQLETMIDLAAAVIVDEDNFGNLELTIDELINQSMPFKEIIFVNSFNNKSNFSKILKIIEDKKIKTFWSLKQVVDPEIGIQYGIDLAFASCKSIFVAKLICGEKINTNFVEKINEYHQQMHKFLVLKPKNSLEHCLVIQRYVYEMVQGNATVEWNDTKEIIIDMLTKIEKIANDQKIDWAIRNLSEVCNCFQEI